ncbi:MAG: CHAD domain-containing protein [Synechococcaceae cyanobacterium]
MTSLPQPQPARPRTLLLPGAAGADPAQASDEALVRLLEWRCAHLQQGLQERIAALRRPFTGSGDSDRAIDRDHVHQLRTGLRRLRSMAEAFPQHWRGPSAGCLRRLARAAGGVRDLDVLLETLEEHRRHAHGPELRRLQQLIRRLESVRARGRRELTGRLRHPPCRLSGAETLADRPATDLAPPLATAHRGALPLLRAGLIRQLADLRLHPGWGHGRRPARGSCQERHQHELRKAFKRLRYQLEVLECLEPALRDRLVLLKRTQDSLGLLQDLAIWRPLLKRHLHGRLKRRLPALAARWRRQADAAWADWLVLRRQWLDPAEGLENWERWLLDLEIPAG